MCAGFVKLCVCAVSFFQGGRVRMLICTTSHEDTTNPRFSLVCGFGALGAVAEEILVAWLSACLAVSVDVLQVVVFEVVSHGESKGSEVHHWHERPNTSEKCLGVHLKWWRRTKQSKGRARAAVC